MDVKESSLLVPRRAIKIMHECICFILHILTCTFIHTHSDSHSHSHSHSHTHHIHIPAQIKSCPRLARKKRRTECSVAFLRLHSCDDGSVKWLLATRRRQPTLILRVLFVNVDVDVGVNIVAALHRKCRYCYQLSRAHPATPALPLPYTSTHPHTSCLRVASCILTLLFSVGVCC